MFTNASVLGPGLIFFFRSKKKISIWIIAAANLPPFVLNVF